MFQNIDTHDPNGQRTHKADTWKPTLWVHEYPRSDDQLPLYLRETDAHPYYKYPQIYKYTLVGIIVIKALIHIFPKN